MKLSNSRWLKQSFFVRATGVVCFILIWWALSQILGSTRLPSPFSVVEAFVYLPFPSRRLAAAGISKTGSIAIQLAYTAGMVLLGAGIGTIVGYLLGLVFARFRSLRDVLEPVFEMIRAVPPLALLPFLAMWVGTGGKPQILLVALFIALMVMVTTLTAVDNLNPLYGKFAATLGAQQRQVFLTIIVPATVPALIGGLRVAIGMAWGFQVVAELVGSRYGTGISLLMMVPRFMTAEVIATILWISFTALFIDLFFLSAMRRLASWQPR